MKPLDHTQARQWIHSAADGLLGPSEQEILQAHLLGCAECQVYAGELQVLEADLKRVMRLRWDGGGLPPHSIDRMMRGTQDGLKGNGGHSVTGSGRLLLKIAGLGALGILAVGLYLGIASFRQYARSFGGATGNSPAGVFIQNPQPGSTFEVGTSVLVQVKASSPLPLVGLELWADGELVGVQSAPTAQGLPSLQGDFQWQSDQPGMHALFARAIDTLGKTATSSSVPVELVEAGQVPPDVIDTNYDPPIPILPGDFGGGGGVPPPGPPPPDGGPAYSPVRVPESLPPDKPGKSRGWSPTLGGWYGFMFTHPKPPLAPAIPASAVEVCAPRIWISDNSDNESGFYVYRRDPGMANFAKIATLDAHTGAIFTYDDENLYGTHLYYVSAFNQAGEAPGNIVRVTVDSPDCKPKMNPTVSLQFSKLPSTFPVDRGYCYVSFDGLDWFRYPRRPGEFLTSLPDGMGLLGPGELARFADQGAPKTLDLECWAWNADGLQELGRWHYDNLPPKPEPSGGGIDPQIGVELDASPDVPGLKYDYRIPYVYASASQDPKMCADFYGTPNPLINALICGSLPAGQGFAVWFPGDNCPAQAWNASVVCFKSWDVIGYRVYDNYHDGGDTPITTVNAPSQVYFLADWLACIPRQVSISALVEVDGEIHEGLPSQAVGFLLDKNCPYWLGQIPRLFRVTWQSVDFSGKPFADEPDSPHDVEGYGYLLVNTADSGFQTYLNLSSHKFQDDPAANPYFFADLPLSQTSLGPCLNYLCAALGAPGNNSVDVPVLGDEFFFIHANLKDSHLGGFDGNICFFTGDINNRFRAKDIDAAGGLYTGTRTSQWADADCTVTFTIEALGP